MFRVRYTNLDRELTLACLNTLQRDLTVLWVCSQGRPVLFVDAGNVPLLQRALERLPLLRLSRADFDPQDKLGAPLRVMFDTMSPEQPFRLALALGRGAVRLTWQSGLLRCEALGDSERIEQALADVWPEAQAVAGWRRAKALFDKGVELPPGRVALPNADDRPTLASRNRALPVFERPLTNGLLLGHQESDGHPLHLPIPLRVVWSGFTALVPPSIWQIVDEWLEKPGRNVVVLDGVGWSARRPDSGRREAETLVSWTHPGQGQRLNPLEPALVPGAQRKGAAVTFDGAAVTFDGAAVAFDGAAVTFDGAAYANLVLEWLAMLGINETLTGTPTYRLLRVMLKFWGGHCLAIAGEPLTPPLIASLLDEPRLTEELPIPPLNDPEDRVIWVRRQWPAARANLMPAADRLRHLLNLPQLNVLWCPPFQSPTSDFSIATILAPGNTRATQAFLASSWLPLRHQITQDTLIVGLGIGELGKRVLDDAEGKDASVLLWGKQVVDACGLVPVQGGLIPVQGGLVPVQGDGEASSELSRVGKDGLDLLGVDIVVSRTPDAPALAQQIGVSCEHILAQADDQVIVRFGDQVAALALPGSHAVQRRPPPVRRRPSPVQQNGSLVVLGPTERAFALFQSLIVQQQRAGKGHHLLLLSGNGRSPAPPDIVHQSLPALDQGSGNPLAAWNGSPVALTSNEPATTRALIAAGLRAGRQAFLWRPGVTPPAKVLKRLRAVVYGEWTSGQVGKWGNEGVTILILGDGAGMPDALRETARELSEGEGLLIEQGKGVRRVRIG